MRALLPAILAGLSALAPADVAAIYGPCFPTGSVLEAPHKVAWKLTPTGGSVTHVDMSLNGAPVEAKFDEQDGEAEYVPQTALAPGFYKVACRITIDRSLIVSNDWCFEIGEGEYGATPVLRQVNLLRQKLGLPACSNVDALSRAARAHALYQDLNRVTAHEEQPGAKAFFGTTPQARALAAGYDGPTFEVASGGISDPERAVRSLFDAPYHRIPFLQPGSPELGVGLSGGALTIDFGATLSEAAVCSPAPGETGVPTCWDGNETPSPLSVHHAGGPVGYPIVFAYFTRDLQDVRSLSIEVLSSDGKLVEGYLNTPETDPELRFAAIFTPKERLQPAATYQVRAEARTKSGQRIQRAWQFTTA